MARFSLADEAIGAEASEPADIGRFTITDLHDCSCRWPVSAVDGPDTFYCGAHRAMARGGGTPAERRAHRGDRGYLRMIGAQA